MHDDDIDTFAAQLRDAERCCQPVEPLTTAVPDLTLYDAYRIQLANVAVRTAAGEQVVGHKIGLTSVAMQQQLGVSEPDFGHLLTRMALDDGASVSLRTLIQPRVEYEIAFVLAHDIEGPGVTIADVLRATEAVFPSLEVIDSRIADWRIGLADTVADAASSARFTLPSRLTSVRNLDLSLVGARLDVNGALRSSASGAAVLGHPARCVAWLANALAAYGTTLRAGHIVMAGALDRALPVASGDTVCATFDRLGTATVHFTTTGES